MDVVEGNNFLLVVMVVKVLVWVIGVIFVVGGFLCDFMVKSIVKVRVVIRKLMVVVWRLVFLWIFILGMIVVFLGVL